MREGWRISDLERDNAVRALGEAMREGRLSPAEFSDRCEAAYLARTPSDLAHALVDLPDGPLAFEPLVLRIAFGQVRRTGNWPVPGLIQITGTGQRTVLDLTEAASRRPDLTVEVTAPMSSTVLVVPAQARVDTDRLVLVAGSLRLREATARRLLRVGIDPDGHSATPGSRGLAGRRRRRAAQDEEPPLRVELRGQARLSTVTVLRPRR